jgi:hypothetical protein
MTKVKVVAFSLLAVLILLATVGWLNRGKMYDFDHSEVKKELAMYNLPFEAKIPSKVPLVDMWLYEANHDDEQVTVTLMNVNKDALGIRISKNSFHYKDDVKQKEIIIGKEKQGGFIPDDSGKRILYWEDDGVYYEITYYSKLTPMEISKKQLVKMAESFE